MYDELRHIRFDERFDPRNVSESDVIQSELVDLFGPHNRPVVGLNEV